MSATDELRRLLDERGIEHKDIKRHYKDDRNPDKLYTLWGIRDYAADSYISAKLHEEYGGDREHFYCFSMTAYNLTPEQAVEATLGRGTCHSDNNPPLLYDDPFRVFRCSECHHKVDLRRNPKPNYCPNCGRKVVDA